MRTKDKSLKSFDTVKVFRNIKEQIVNDIKEMNIDELKAYLKKGKLITTK